MLTTAREPIRRNGAWEHGVLIGRDSCAEDTIIEELEVFSKTRTGEAE